MPEITREERWQLAEGLTAVRMDRRFAGGTIATLTALVNGRGVTLFGNGDLAPFDAIARTLRAVSKTAASQPAATRVPLPTLMLPPAYPVLLALGWRAQLALP